MLYIMDSRSLRRDPSEIYAYAPLPLLRTGAVHCLSGSACASFSQLS